MRSISFPDPLYVEAQRAAEASGMSVEAYIQRAVQITIHSEAPLVLTPEQIEIVERGRTHVREGRFFTVDQVEDHFAKKRAAWIESESA